MEKEVVNCRLIIIGDRDGGNRRKWKVCRVHIAVCNFAKKIL
jgi:hypothetical protein